MGIAAVLGQGQASKYRHPNLEWVAWEANGQGMSNNRAPCAAVAAEPMDETGGLGDLHCVAEKLGGLVSRSAAPWLAASWLLGGLSSLTSAQSLMWKRAMDGLRARSGGGLQACRVLCVHGLDPDTSRICHGCQYKKSPYRKGSVSWTLKY